MMPTSVRPLGDRRLRGVQLWLGIDEGRWQRASECNEQDSSFRAAWVGVDEYAKVVQSAKICLGLLSVGNCILELRFGNKDVGDEVLSAVGVGRSVEARLNER